MNVVFNGLKKETGIKILERYAIDRAYNVANRKVFYKKEDYKTNTKIEHLDYWDTLHGTYESVEWETLKPLDQEIIDQFAEVEIEALLMEERNPPQTGLGWDGVRKLPFNEALYKTVPNKYFYFFNSKTYLERRRIYLRHLRYWVDFYSKNNISIFIAHPIPHDTCQFVGWKVAEKFNIPYLMITETSVPDYHLIVSDYKRMNGMVDKEISRIKNNYKNINEIQLSEAFQAEWTRITDSKGESFKPWYFKNAEKEIELNNNKSNSLRKGFKGVLNLIRTNFKKFFEIDYLFYRYKLAKGYSQSLWDQYNSYSIKPDLTQKFYYLALHYQPELTSCPKGGAYAHQKFIADMVTYHLPEDTFLYIKEHPAQDFAVRDYYFYEDLNKNKKIKFVNIDTPSEALLDACVATVTVTGTVAWEGLGKNKPCLLFGYHPNMFAPGVFPIVTNKECKEAIDEISKGVSISELDLKLFFKALEKVSKNCHYHMPITKLTPKENALIIAEEYIKEMDQLFPDKIK